MKKIFDYIVITVASQFQKDFLKSKLIERKKDLDNGTEYKIIIEKEKVGSGGALLKLVKEINTNQKKILLINSAGKSQRMPLYADRGKICSPTFKNENSILLDEIFEEAMPIGEKMNTGILIVSGDCTTMYTKIDGNVFKNNTAFSVLADAKKGEKHGVFVVEDKKLKESLQKEKVGMLKLKNAIINQNKVNIDTGIIYFNEEMVEKLKKIEFNNNVIINLYTDLIYPLCTESKLEKYLYQKSETEITKDLISVRKSIWNEINSNIIFIETLDNGEFVHYGTTEEFLEIAAKRSNSLYSK